MVAIDSMVLHIGSMAAVATIAAVASMSVPEPQTALNETNFVN